MSANQKTPAISKGVATESGNEETIEGSNPDRNGTQGKPKIVVGNPKDVLCGRGLHILNHHGNLQLHLLVNKYKKHYQDSRRREKSRIILNIIREIKGTGARFLKRVEGEGSDSWAEVDDKKAYEKVSHALRLQKNNESNRLQPHALSHSKPETHERRSLNAQQSHLSSFAGWGMVGSSHASSAIAPPPSFPPQNAFLQDPSPAATLSTASSFQGLGQTAGEFILYESIRRQMMLTMLSYLQPQASVPLHVAGENIRPCDTPAVNPDSMPSRPTDSSDGTKPGGYSGG